MENASEVVTKDLHDLHIDVSLYNWITFQNLKLNLNQPQGEGREGGGGGGRHTICCVTNCNFIVNYWIKYRTLLLLQGYITKYVYGSTFNKRCITILPAVYYNIGYGIFAKSSSTARACFICPFSSSYAGYVQIIPCKAFSFKRIFSRKLIVFHLAMDSNTF